MSSALLVYASGLKETKETMESVLHLMKYLIYNWNICRDLKSDWSSPWFAISLYQAPMLVNASCVIGTVETTTLYLKRLALTLRVFFSKIYHVPLLNSTKVSTLTQIRLGILKNLLKQWIKMAMDLSTCISDFPPNLMPK